MGVDMSEITEEKIVIEVPSESIDSVDIQLPAWVGELSVFGVTVGSAFGIVSVIARKWLAYSPIVRRLFPGAFAGSWDEKVDQIAGFIKGSDIRFVGVPDEEIKQALKDPAQVAKLLTTGAKLKTEPDPQVSLVSHIAIENEPEPDPVEEYPNQRLWELINATRDEKKNNA